MPPNNSPAPGSLRSQHPGREEIPSLFDRLALSAGTGAATLDDLERLRARLVVRIALLSIPFWVLYGCIWHLTGLERGLHLALCGAAACLLWVPLLRAGLAPPIAGRGLAISAACTFFALALLVRGFDIPLLAWNLLIPVAAILFRGPRTAIGWVLILILSWLLLWWLDLLGHLPRPNESVPAELLRLLDVSNLVGAMLMLVMIVGSHASVQERRRLEQEELRKQLTRSEHLAGLGTLAASIGHEIHNPLAYVVHNLEYLHRPDGQRASPGQDGNDQAKALQDALEGARRVQRISAGLNAFARRDTEPGPIAVEDSVRVALDLAQAALRQVARIDVDIQPGLTVRASEQLVQVLLNLLVNAADAIATGSEEQREAGTIQIAAFERGEFAYIEVTDNGPGIPELDRQRMFDPFFTTKKPGKGTGLGLAISKQIMNQLSGKITATPASPRGTLMRLRLEPAVAPPPSLPRLHLPDPSPAHLLIIDDEPALLRAMRRHLSEHRVDLASTGAEALEMLSKNHYDLILCDVMMPEMTGPELLDRARNELGGSIEDRFLFMTGGVFTEEQSLALRQTGCPTLPKPVGCEAIQKQIRRRRRTDWRKVNERPEERDGET